MKKKILIIIIILLIILLVPIPKHLKDRGIVEYKSLTYKISKVNDNGLVITILNRKVYDSTTKVNLSSEETYQKISKTIDNVTLEMDISNTWKFEDVLDVDDSYKYALKFYKSDEDKNVILYFYNQSFGVCGTDRTTKKISLNNGYSGTIGYYDSEWSDISFYELNPNIAFINNGLESNEAEEFLEFVKTFNIE
jgi:hypothetical protein